MADAPPLVFESVSFTYRGDWLQRIEALKDVSFTVPPGAAYGFLGANGAGKSTSIKLLNGLIHGHKGNIRLFGQPLGSPALRKQIGYLPEHPFFYENLKVSEYLRYLGKLSGLDAAGIVRGQERVYHLLDLGDLRDRQLGSFSKGMRQRFGLAQALLHEPSLLVLDEPFSGLDPLWRARFREILNAEHARGASLFFSSHILSDVEDVCDHYAVIDHGVVLESGALDQLLGQAPLRLDGTGPAPGGAEIHSDGSWHMLFAEDRREEALAAVAAAGGSVLRLERQRQALEDYFVNKVRAHHGAGGAFSAGGAA
ncbi:MAG: ABC transporter ATP-binding protein [Planctomycetota bacterium]|jgi:ABC-2 type transport system ATP-binding protein|nr:ABC transporter ATP-binding protein [Planctomycetota bacterium]